MSSRFKLAFAIWLAVWLPASPTLGHHSFAMFDNEKDVTLVGTIKELQWMNPHIWLQVLVVDEATQETVEWSLEAGSPNAMRRQGWSRRDFVPGEPVKVVIHPMKDGRNGGSIVDVFIDGKRIGY